MLHTHYHPARHEILDTEISRFLRRHLDRPDLFTYRHRRTGRWVVSRWIQPRQTFEELYGMDTLGEFDRAAVLALTAWRDGALPSQKEVIQDYRGRVQQETRDHVREITESRDRMRFIGRKLQSDDPMWKRDGLPHSFAAERV